MPAARRSRQWSLSDLARVEAALQRALREALGRHMKLGHTVPEWVDGRVKWMEPAELLRNGNGHGPKRARKSVKARAKPARGKRTGRS